MLEASLRTIEGGITLLELKGRITLGAETRRLEQTVKSFQPQDLRLVVIDMSAVEYLDSAGIGVLTACLVAVRGVSGKLHLAGPNAKIRQLLRFTGLDRMMPVFADIEEACRPMTVEPGAEDTQES